MKRKRLLVTLASVILALLIVGATAGIVIDTGTKAVVEKGGTYALGVPTTLASANIDLLSGSASLQRLHIANPPGFQTDHFFALNSGSVTVKTMTLIKPSAVGEVDEVALDGIKVNLEKNAQRSNYQMILDNLRKFEKKEPAGQPAPDSEQKKFLIRKLTLRNVEVRVDLIGLPGKASAVTIPIHEITLHNIGADRGGATVGKVSGEIVKATLASAVGRAGGLIPSDVSSELKAGLSQLEDLGKLGVEVIGEAGQAAQKLTEGLAEIGSEAGKAIKEGTEGLIKGLGDLIPGKNKK
jgi:hypothetical protein